MITTMTFMSVWYYAQRYNVFLLQTKSSSDSDRLLLPRHRQPVFCPYYSTQTSELDVLSLDRDRIHDLLSSRRYNTSHHRNRGTRVQRPGNRYLCYWYQYALRRIIKRRIASRQKRDSQHQLSTSSSRPLSNPGIT